MTPVGSSAQTKAAANRAPARYLYFFQGNGFYPGAWNPEGAGTDFTLSKTLASWEPFKEKVTVIRNLKTIAYGTHIGRVSALLTGHQAERDPKTGRFLNKKTVDQVIADKIGADTLYRSIHAGLEHPGLGYCSSINMPVSYGSTISWANGNTPLQPEVTPRGLFDMLFRRESAPEVKERAAWQGSILDGVLQEATALQHRGSALDKQKVEEYLDSVRTVEKRIKASALNVKKAWTPPTHPSEKEFDEPVPGVPTDRREHARQMLDVLTLALWTDSSRVFTFMFANPLSEGDFRFLGPVTTSFHNTYSHHGNNPEKVSGYSAINTWHAGQVAYLASKLDAIKEDDGKTLLDNCALFFGGSLKDGNIHANVDLPVALIGSAGGRFKPAGHIFTPEYTNIANLHLTALGWFGIDQPDFNGMSTGKIPEIA